MSSGDIATATATIASATQSDNSYIVTSDIVKLETKDKVIVSIDVDCLKLSKTLTDLLEDANDQVYKGVAIPLKDIKSSTLDLVIQYLRHHNEHPNEHLDFANKGLDEIAEWDVDFCTKLNNNALFDLILASNYLNIEPLLKLTCKIVARKIKGKKSDEIKEILKLEEETD